MRLEVAGHRPVTEQPLEARFFDLDTHIIYRIGCSPVAFRVLDEHGLVELWHAMNEQRRPVGSSTFMVRNHGWSRESELSFMHGTRDGYSYIIATRLECLEIVAIDTPVIEQVGMAEASALSSAKRH
ncbi:MAG TPA: hypothetical protein VH331_16240 [Allosphingosinicella sp.]|nr:hypothetical protein [Allosphingosinicella sp.]